MSNKVVIGVDTSNYTTSLAVSDINGNVIDNYRILLPVKEGERGLRQSEAVFAHVKNFQIIANDIKKKHADYDIVALGYSAYPRDCEGSYMPCFLVGEAVAEMISALYNIPAYKFSHQAGHIQSAIYSSGVKIEDSFIAFHVSGGTTEILYVTPNNGSFDIKKIGGCNDLHAGQAIDRIGVKMGLKFPCGKEIEYYAKQNTEAVPLPKISVNEFSCNLSGLENLAFDLFDKTSSVPLVSSYTLSFIEKTISKLTKNLRKAYGNIKILYAGGVMSNSIIKNSLNTQFNNLYFAKPEFSTDNAAGISLLTLGKL